VDVLGLSGIYRWEDRGGRGGEGVCLGGRGKVRKKELQIGKFFNYRKNFKRILHRKAV
jgi:hypothetical protein